MKSFCLIVISILSIANAFVSNACEVPYKFPKVNELIDIKVKGKETVKIEVQAPKSLDGWGNPQFVLWGNDESNPVILYLSSTTNMSNPNLETVTLTGPAAMFKGTEIQIHYYKKEESCAKVARKEILL